MNINKKIISFFMSIVLVAIVFTAQNAQTLQAEEVKPVKKNYQIQVNETMLKDANVYESKGTILIPLRQTGEDIGFKIIWEPKTNSVRMDDGKVQFRVYLGKTSVYGLDDDLKQSIKKEKLTAAPIKIKGKVYVPYQLFHILYETDEVASFGGNLVKIQTEPDILGGMPNPLKKMNTVEEAEKAAGFTIPMPDIQGKTGKPDQIILIANDTIELKFVLGDQEIKYRKGANVEDVSGDYTVYKQVKQEKINDTAVTLKGESDKFTLATWKIGEDAYAVRYKNPVSIDEVITFVISVLS